MAQKWRRTWTVNLTCDTCGATKEHDGLDKSTVAWAVRNSGWSLGKKDKCRVCSGKKAAKGLTS